MMCLARVLGQTHHDSTYKLCDHLCTHITLSNTRQQLQSPAVRRTNPKVVSCPCALPIAAALCSLGKQASPVNASKAGFLSV